jgi:hypothetical protein
MGCGNWLIEDVELDEDTSSEMRIGQVKFYISISCSRQWAGTQIQAYVKTLLIQDNNSCGPYRQERH